MIKLGSTQKEVLDCLDKYWNWRDHPFGSGWFWQTASVTRKALESLVKKGLVDKKDHHYESSLGQESCPEYSINPQGKEYLEKVKNHD